MHLSDHISRAMIGCMIPWTERVNIKVRSDGVNVVERRTLMKKALRKAAGNLSLYLLVTRTPPTTVAALLANVNCKTHTHTHLNLKDVCIAPDLEEPERWVGESEERSWNILRR